jgi:hypothetical protein
VIKKSKIGGTHSTYLERRVAYKDLVEIPEGKRESGRPWSTEKITLKLTFKKYSKGRRLV